MRYLESLALACLAVFAPIKAVLATTLVLVLLDTATGVYAAYRRKEKITSTGLKRTAGKIALYEFALCVAFLAQHYLIGDDFPACKLVSAMVGLVELKSILENLDSISGTDLFQSILSAITHKQDKP